MNQALHICQLRALDGIHTMVEKSSLLRYLPGHNVRFNKDFDKSRAMTLSTSAHCIAPILADHEFSRTGRQSRLPCR